MSKFRISRADKMLGEEETERMERDQVQTKRGVWVPVETSTRVVRVKCERGVIEYRGMCGGYVGRARLGGAR